MKSENNATHSHCSLTQRPACWVNRIISLLVLLYPPKLAPPASPDPLHVYRDRACMSVCPNLTDQSHVRCLSMWCLNLHPPHCCPLHCTPCCVRVFVLFACLNQNVRVQESRAGFSGSVSIPSITKNRAEPGRSMSASSGLGIREWQQHISRLHCTSLPAL